MKLDELRPAPGSKTTGRRIGRGVGSGLGKTSGKGHKGQNARSGGGVRPGFEGGQMPLMRRLPKRGFTNIFSKEYAIVNVGALNEFKANSKIDAAILLEKGIISKVGEYGIKILGDGELNVALKVTANAWTKEAEKKIQKAGGEIKKC
jgi:large subunit ribosomal protein L15